MAIIATVIIIIINDSVDARINVIGFKQVKSIRSGGWGGRWGGRREVAEGTLTFIGRVYIWQAAVTNKQTGHQFTL